MLSLAAAALVTKQILNYRIYPFDYDEANHANGALAMYLELRAHDFGGFIGEFFQQGFYPPGFSWLKALSFLVFGASPVVARMFSVVCLFLAGLVIYATALETDEKHGWLSGMMATTLTWTSQSLLVNSGLVMMEAPGLLASFTMLWFYLRAIKQPTTARLIATSFLLALTFLSKYTYGVVAVATIIAMESSLTFSLWKGVKSRDTDEPNLNPNLSQRVYPGIRNLVTRRWLWLLGPFALVMITWFGQSENVEGFLSYATSQPPDQPWLTAENLLFYPRSIALHHTPGPLFALLTLAGVFWGITHSRNPLVRLILIYFAVGMGAMTVNLPKNPRFITTFVPAAHILTAMVLGRVLAYRNADRPKARIAANVGIAATIVCVILGMPVLIDRIAMYPSLMEVQYETDPEANNVAAWIADQIPDGERFLLVNYWDQFNAQSMAWYLGTHEDMVPPNLRFADVSMPAVLIEPASPTNITALREKILQGDVSYLVLLEGGPWGEPFWPEYTMAMQDMLALAARERFAIQQYDLGGWLGRSLLTKAEWEQVKKDSHFTLDLQVIVYNLMRP